MKPRKLRNLLEFKDRNQVRNLLSLASGISDEKELNEVLLTYITDSKLALHGFYEGPLLQALIGIHMLQKKEAEILHIAVRPEDENSDVEGELMSMVQAKYKLTKLTGQ